MKWRADKRATVGRGIVNVPFYISMSSDFIDLTDPTTAKVREQLPLARAERYACRQVPRERRLPLCHGLPTPSGMIANDGGRVTDGPDGAVVPGLYTSAPTAPARWRR